MKRKKEITSTTTILNVLKTNPTSSTVGTGIIAGFAATSAGGLARAGINDHNVNKTSLIQAASKDPTSFVEGQTSGALQSVVDIRTSEDPEQPIMTIISSALGSTLACMLPGFAIYISELIHSDGDGLFILIAKLLAVTVAFACFYWLTISAAAFYQPEEKIPLNSKFLLFGRPSSWDSRPRPDVDAQEIDMLESGTRSVVGEGYSFPRMSGLTP